MPTLVLVEKVVAYFAHYFAYLIMSLAARTTNKTSLKMDSKWYAGRKSNTKRKLSVGFEPTTLTVPTMPKLAPQTTLPRRHDGIFPKHQ